MIRVPVESSDIVSIGYDEPSATLEIEFHGGRLYQYRNVEPQTHDQLMRADSHGQFFNTFIHGRYRFDRVAGSDEPEASKTLAFVTGNERKFRDLQHICAQQGIEIEQLVLSIDEIQSQDAEDIAIKKAKAAYRMANRPVLVNDAYWNIIALHGFPGAYMADVNRWFKAEDFLHLLDGKHDRTAICTDTVVYYDGKRSKVFTYDWIGTVTKEPRGKGLAPIDQVLQLEGDTMTIAEREDKGGYVAFDSEENAWHAFAKWYKLQRRMGRV